LRYVCAFVTAGAGLAAAPVWQQCLLISDESVDATQSIYGKATGASTADIVTEPTDAEAERRSAQSTSGSGLGAAAQHLASVKSGLSDRRTLVVKLVIVTQKEEIVTQATLDTGSEVDIVSPDFARQLWHAGARYGDRGGCIKGVVLYSLRGQCGWQWRSQRTRMRT
jgi:hypothetical protein